MSRKRPAKAVAAAALEPLRPPPASGLKLDQLALDLVLSAWVLAVVVTYAAGHLWPALALAGGVLQP